MTSAGREQLAVMGQPIAHSKSPAIHRAAYRALGLDWEYGRVESDAAGLDSALQLKQWHGLSLTMPLKERAFEIASAAGTHRVDVNAQRAGGVNTLLRDRKDGGWRGWNTDIPGLVRVIAEHRIDPSHTVVLGTGATAVSALLAASDAGAQRITVAGRRPDAVGLLVSRFETLPDTVVAGAQLKSFTAEQTTGHPDAETVTAVISTLPGAAAATLSISPELFRVPLVDVAYDPWPSPFAQQWHNHSGVAHSGLEMLLFQALLQIRIFRNGDIDQPLPDEQCLLTVMRDAVTSG